MEYLYDDIKERLDFLDFGKISNEILLEIGIGKLKLSIIAAKHRNCSITAIDIENSVIENANKIIKEEGLTEQIKLFRQDARQLPYSQKSFSSVTCF